MEWHKLTKNCLPPVSNQKSILLWRGANEDGGFPTTAKHVQYHDAPPSILYVKPTGWEVLEEKHYRGCMWAMIDPPEEAKRAREKWESKCRKAE